MLKLEYLAIAKLWNQLDNYLTHPFDYKGTSLYLNVHHYISKCSLNLSTWNRFVQHFPVNLAMITLFKLLNFIGRWSWSLSSWLLLLLPLRISVQLPSSWNKPKTTTQNNRNSLTGWYHCLFYYAHSYERETLQIIIKIHLKCSVWVL